MNRKALAKYWYKNRCKEPPHCGRYFFNAPHIPHHLPHQHIPTAYPHMLFTYHITIPYLHLVLLNIWFLSFFSVVYILTWRLLCWASKPVYAQCLRRQKISPTNMVGGRWIYWISPLFSEHYSFEPPTTRFVRWFFICWIKGSKKWDFQLLEDVQAQGLL